MPKADRARKAYVEKGIAEAKQILNEPGPQVPQEVLDEVNFGGGISSDESFEILEFPHGPIKQYWAERKLERRTKARPRLPAAQQG